MKGQRKRDWTEAEHKRDFCRVCGLYNSAGHGLTLTLAHVIGREHDRKSGYRVLPERVVCLCGPVGYPGKCHTQYDAHELDLWHLLTFEEQAQAIDDAGSYWLAVKRCSPVAYRQFLEDQKSRAA